MSAATVTGGLQPLVERLEDLSPGELGAGYESLRADAGHARHMTLIGLLAAARSLDWAPSDLAGTLDLTAASARAVLVLCDRLPAAAREERTRFYTLAVAHRLHESRDCAPYVLPEIAPDADRIRDPKGTWVELQEALRAGAVTRGLHAWPCCLARTPWSQATELMAELALGDGATLGARAVAAASVRRALEVVGREHRHPVITALWRALAAAPRGDDPAPAQLEALGTATEQADVPVDPIAGEAVDTEALVQELATSDAPAAIAGRELAAGKSAGSVLEAVAAAACDRILALEGDAHAGWVGETLVVVNAMRDLDGREDGHLRPRVVVEAARLLGLRTRHAVQRGATFARSNAAPAAGAQPEDLRAPLAAADGDTCSAIVAALAGDPRRAAEAIQILDATAPFDPRDLAPLRLHLAATDEYRRSEGALAARFLQAATRACTQTSLAGEA